MDGKTENPLSVPSLRHKMFIPTKVLYVNWKLNILLYNAN